MASPTCVGIGYDIHRLVEGRRLVVGGIEIPHTKGLLGHSDADVVLHAVTDALLGAAGLPDIGDLFPDSDPAYKDADSRVLLKDAMERVHAPYDGEHRNGDNPSGTANFRETLTRK